MEDKKQTQLRIKRKWYQRNRKERGYEYDFINFHKSKIFDLLPNKCKNCKKQEVNIIHHKKYGKTPKLKYIGIGARENEKKSW